MLLNRSELREMSQDAWIMVSFARGRDMTSELMVRRLVRPRGARTMIAQARIVGLRSMKGIWSKESARSHRVSRDLVRRTIPVVVAVCALPALLAVLVVGGFGMLVLAVVSLFSGSTGGHGGWRVDDDSRTSPLLRARLFQRRALPSLGNVFSLLP
jgi:nitrate reductase NapE component